MQVLVNTQAQDAQVSKSKNVQPVVNLRILADHAFAVLHACLDNPDRSPLHQPTEQDWDVHDFPNPDSIVRAIRRLLDER